MRGGSGGGNGGDCKRTRNRLNSSYISLSPSTVSGCWHRDLRRRGLLRLGKASANGSGMCCKSYLRLQLLRQRGGGEAATVIAAPGVRHAVHGSSLLCAVALQDRRPHRAVRANRIHGGIGRTRERPLSAKARHAENIQAVSVAKRTHTVCYQSSDIWPCLDCKIRK